MRALAARSPRNQQRSARRNNGRRPAHRFLSPRSAPADKALAEKWYSFLTAAKFQGCGHIRYSAWRAVCGLCVWLRRRGLGERGRASLFFPGFFVPTLPDRR